MIFFIRKESGGFILPSILCAITIIVHSPTFFNEFQVAWDDQWAVTGNPFIHNPSVESLKILFTEFYYGQYAPLNVLFYYILYLLFGFNPAIFHGACLIVHLLNVFLVYKLIRKIVSEVKPGYSIDRVWFISFLVALIFGIHPLQVESVAWVSASKIPLYSFFYLLSLLTYIKFLKKRTYNRFGLIILLFIIALGFKEQAIVLPLAFFTIDFIYNRINFKDPIESFFTNKVFIEKLPLFFIALFFWYFSAQFNVGNIALDNTFPLNQRLFLGAKSMMDYVFRFLVPLELYFFYPVPFEVGEKSPFYLWIYIVLVAIICGFIINHYNRKNKIIVFGFLFFLVNIFLVLHIIPVPRRFLTADRYIYLSIIGFSIIGIWLLQVVFVKCKKYRRALYLALIFYLISLGVQSFNRTQDWKTTKVLKSDLKEKLQTH